MTNHSAPTHWLFLRGLSRESAHWQDFVDRCAQQLGWQCHSIDLPGFGSQYLRRSPLSIAGIRQDLQTRFAAASQESFGIVALSLGGMVALDWLDSAPQQVSRVILINSSSSDCPIWQRLRPSLLLPLSRALCARRIEHQEQAVLKMVSNYHSGDSALLEHYCALRHRHPSQRRNVLRQLWAASRFRAPKVLPANTLRVLASQQDRMVSWRCSEYLANAYDAPLALHPSAGHDLPLDAPEWLIARFAEWQ